MDRLTRPYSEISGVEDVESVDQSIEKHNQNITIRTSSLKFYAVGSTVFNILALVLLLFQIQSHHSPASTMNDDSPIVKQFLANSSYMSLDHKYDSLWYDQVMYPLRIHTSEKLKDGEKPDGIITMFHQLHCLKQIRKALQQAREGNDAGTNEDDFHWPNCFDFLRQSVLCHADNVIERLDIGQDKVISGSQDYRKCKDSSILYAQVHQNHWVDKYLNVLPGY